jgi:Kef-type K+ transport system membrane component KefB
MRVIAFSILTPFYFLKAGTLIGVRAVLAGMALIGAFLAVKMAAKFFGVWPLAHGFSFGRREAMYTTLLMSTGLTFGTISALYGLSHGLIDPRQYAVLVTAVILSAIVPTVIAETWFDPSAAPREETLTRRSGDARSASVPRMSTRIGKEEESVSQDSCGDRRIGRREESADDGDRSGETLRRRSAPDLD